MDSLSYFTARARHLTPALVAKSAARRAMRSAKQFLYRRYQRIEDEALLQAFGVDSAERLVTAAFESARAAAWCHPARRDSVVTALIAHPEANERAWTRAKRALARTYRVFERELRFERGAPIDWSLDPVSGYRYPCADSTELQLTVPGADPKYPWQLARLEAAVALGQGYWLASTAEERGAFADEFVALVSDFLRANPPDVGIHWTCPMEVALRAANIAQALWMIRDAPALHRPEVMLDLLRGLCEHCAFVEANLEDRGLVPNNHLIADVVGLLVVGLLFPRLPGAAAQVELARRVLREQVPQQVFEDGVSFEGSTGYHRLVAELCVIATVFARGHGVELGAEVTQRTHGLLRAAAAWCSEAGRAPQLGDNDSGRALALSDRASLDHGYLGNLGAVLFADGTMKERGDGMCEEALWLFGDEGAQMFACLPAKADAVPKSFCSREGGLHVLRGGGAVVTLSAGPQGQRGAGGHSHNDKLSFELHVGGAPVIVDPGSPLYARDPSARNAWRSSAVHNAVMVDGLEQSEFDPARLFALPDGARANVEVFETSAVSDRIVALHHGYERLTPPVTVRRELVLNKQHRALVIDESLEGGVGSTRAITVTLQLPDSEVRVRGPRGAERQRAAALLPGRPLDETIAIELGPKDAPRAVLLLQPGAEVALEPSQTATGYGEITDAVKIVLRAQVKLPCSWAWVVLVVQDERRVEERPLGGFESPIGPNSGNSRGR